MAAWFGRWWMPTKLLLGAAMVAILQALTPWALFIDWLQEQARGRWSSFVFAWFIEHLDRLPTAILVLGALVYVGKNLYADSKAGRFNRRGRRQHALGRLNDGITEFRAEADRRFMNGVGLRYGWHLPEGQRPPEDQLPQWDQDVNEWQGRVLVFLRKHIEREIPGAAAHFLRDFDLPENEQRHYPGAPPAAAAILRRVEYRSARLAELENAMRNLVASVKQ